MERGIQTSSLPGDTVLVDVESVEEMGLFGPVPKCCVQVETSLLRGRCSQLAVALQGALAQVQARRVVWLWGRTRPICECDMPAWDGTKPVLSPRDVPILSIHKSSTLMGQCDLYYIIIFDLNKKDEFGSVLQEVRKFSFRKISVSPSAVKEM